MSKLPPSPPLAPITGHLKGFRNDPINFMLNSARDHGDIVLFKLLNKKVYFINHPDYIRQVMQTNHKMYHKSPSYKQLEHVGGKGIFTSDGERWLMQRKLYQPAFSHESIQNYAQIVTDESDIVLDSWSDQVANGEDINASREMMRLTVGIISKSLFSTKIDYSGGMYEALSYVLQWINDRALRYPFVAPVGWPTPKNQKFRKHLGTLDKVIYDIIEAKKSNNENPNDLLSRFMEPGGNLEGLGPKELRDEVMTIFLAGHETSANALMWAVHCLTLHPEAEQKILDEINAIDSDELGYEHLRDLAYTTMVLNETMRLYPPVWHLGRLNLSPDKIGEYEIPEGSHIRLSPLTLHRHPDFWKNPDQFIPERFTPEKMKEQHQFVYIPFGAGPRLCAGRNFAMMEMILVLAKLVQRYKIVGEYKQIEMAPMLSLRPEKDVMVKFEKR